MNDEIMPLKENQSNTLNQQKNLNSSNLII